MGSTFALPLISRGDSCVSKENTFAKKRKRKVEPVSLPHALGVWALDVLLDDLLPPPAAQPAPEEALDLLDLVHLGAGLGYALEAADAVRSADPSQRGSRG